MRLGRWKKGRHFVQFATEPGGSPMTRHFSNARQKKLASVWQACHTDIHEQTH